MDIVIILKFFTALLAVMNPFIILPLFMAITEGKKEKVRHIIKTQTTIALSFILFITLFAGNKILRAFGISAGAFETAGGVIIFLIAMSMAQGKTSTMHDSSEEENDGRIKENPSIVPLAMPLLGGPGTIATIVVHSNYFVGVEGYIAASIAILLCIFLVWIVFSFAHKLTNILGKTGLKIITRIMGILLASIAIEMIANGLKDLLPL